ncbi:MAG: metallophosphoesterase family protein, partial [Chloroflexi bacterium]|nr:metallophosphoesterase family protein [Chloroflexota bacterium]
GDIYTASVLDDLERLAPVLAAEGDDDPRATVTDRRVERKHVLTFDGVTIWLAHEIYKIALPLNSREAPDVLVCGHTHQASLKNDNGVIQINPGSATFPRYRVTLGTVGLLTINSGKAEAQIIQLQ